MDPNQNQINIDWQSAESHLLLNPRLSPGEAESLNALYLRFGPELPGHLWVCSSGSTASNLRSAKLIALSKSAFLISARAVNLHLMGNADDIWCLSLPLFHVGGMAILARSYLSGAKVVDYSSYFSEWSAENFGNLLSRKKASLCSLVPTQVYDLVKAGIKSPTESMRAVVVGGASLEPELYYKARGLGWPLLPSFGMTEVCSQVATAEISSVQNSKYPRLKVMSHLQCSVNTDSKLIIQGPGLMSGYAEVVDGEQRFNEVPSTGLLTEDCVLLNEGYLQPLGRDSDFVKVLGEGVNLLSVEAQFLEFCRESAFPEAEIYVIASSDPRRGVNLDLVALKKASNQSFSRLIERFNLTVSPIQRLRKVRFVDQFPKTALGKIQRSLLAEK